MVERSRAGVSGKRGPHIPRWLDAIDIALEFEAHEVDGIVASIVHKLDSFSKRHAGPRGLAKLVRVVMNEPVGVQLLGELALPAKDGLPCKRVGAPWCPASRTARWR